MKSHRIRALAAESANAQERTTLKAETVQPQPTLKGNRRQRREQAVRNKLLNRQITRATAKGPVNITIGPDGIPHVTVRKEKALAIAKAALEEVKANPQALVSGPGREGLGPRPLRDLDEVAAEELAKLPVPERVHPLLEGELNRQRALSVILDGMMMADEC